MKYDYKTDSDSQTEFAENAWFVGNLIRKVVNALPDNAAWGLHNKAAHPVVSALNLAGLNRASDWVHNITMPLPPSDPNMGLVLIP